MFIWTKTTWTSPSQGGQSLSLCRPPSEHGSQRTACQLRCSESTQVVDMQGDGASSPALELIKLQTQLAKCPPPLSLPCHLLSPPTAQLSHQHSYNHISPTNQVTHMQVTCVGALCHLKILLWDPPCVLVALFFPCLGHFPKRFSSATQIPSFSSTTSAPRNASLSSLLFKPSLPYNVSEQSWQSVASLFIPSPLHLGEKDRLCLTQLSHTLAHGGTHSLLHAAYCFIHIL